MEFKDVFLFCETFYKRFSTLHLYNHKLKLLDMSDSCSISLVKGNEDEDVVATITIDTDSVRILKINSFEKINTLFPFDTFLELYTNLLTILMLSCEAGGVYVSTADALSVTLGRKVKTWRELVIYICSLATEEQGLITVQENKQNALKFLKTTFQVQDGFLITDGLYRSQTPYKDTLEMLRAVLDAMSAVFKIHDYQIDPFFHDVPLAGGVPPMSPNMEMPPPMDLSGLPVAGQPAPTDMSTVPAGAAGFPGDMGGGDPSQAPLPTGAA